MQLATSKFYAILPTTVLYCTYFSKSGMNQYILIEMNEWMNEYINE
jgi:hypothetical protein